MSRFNVFPDAEAAVSKAIRDAGFRAYSSIPKKPTWPLFVVQRLGGQPPVRQYLDEARIQVDAWGGASGDGVPVPVSKGDLHDIAQEARVAIFNLEGTTVHDPVDAFISGVDDALGLSWLPDPVTGRDRYIFSLYLYLRSAPDEM